MVRNQKLAIWRFMWISPPVTVVSDINDLYLIKTPSIMIVPFTCIYFTYIGFVLFKRNINSLWSHQTHHLNGQITPQINHATNEVSKCKPRVTMRLSRIMDIITNNFPTPFFPNKFPFFSDFVISFNTIQQVFNYLSCWVTKYFYKLLLTVAIVFICFSIRFCLTLSISLTLLIRFSRWLNCHSVIELD